LTNEYSSEVKELLNSYGVIKKEIAVCKQAGVPCAEKEEKIKFLDFCLGVLETYERELIMAICMNGISIRQYSRCAGFSRNFIAKERDRILSMLTRFFVIKYKS